MAEVGKGVGGAAARVGIGIAQQPEEMRQYRICHRVVAGVIVMPSSIVIPPFVVVAIGSCSAVILEEDDAQRQ